MTSSSEKLYGLDLFSGVGGISKAIEPWVRTVCYVEIDPYAQSVLRSRIKDGELDDAPIWDDITTFDPAPWSKKVDIITGGFPARICQWRERGQDWQESEADYFSRLCGWPKSSDPSSYFLKTSRQSPTEDWERLSPRLPRWGMIVGGVFYPLTMWGLHTNATVGSVWPTVTTDSATDRSKKYAQGGMPLSLAVKMCPTPTVCGNYYKKGASATSGDGLATAVKKHSETFPTATASCWRSGKASEQTMNRNSRPLQEVVYARKTSSEKHQSAISETSGSLNPDWVELLMGYPKGWTKLIPLKKSDHNMDQPWPPTWEDGIPRVSDDKIKRKNRLKCMGNSVVPLQVRTAFKLLIGIKSQS